LLNREASTAFISAANPAEPSPNPLVALGAAGLLGPQPGVTSKQQTKARVKVPVMVPLTPRNEVFDPPIIVSPLVLSLSHLSYSAGKRRPGRYYMS
jgi:hypothetical protein